jgi:succinate dehydrogenase/fumarate reductase-like Fe-S protein
VAPGLFAFALHASLALCVLGVGWRVAHWLRVRIGPDARGIAPPRRAMATLAAIGAALAGRRGLRVLGDFCFDALLLRRLFAKERLRAVAHALVAVGFTLLVLTHALAPLVTARLFPAWQPTLEPWLFLRNLFGAMALAGVALLVLGRRRARARLPRRRFALAFAALLALVLGSGFLLEAQKIASPRAFHRMTEQFAASADPAALASLRALWAQDYGVAFDSGLHAVAPAVTEAGRRLHESACASCHARPAAAFVSWPLARAIAPATGLLDAARADAWLLHLHVLACLLGLATLPFTTFFHVLAAPVSLIADAAARHRDPAAGRWPAEARATRRALAEDACVRCGLCDHDCSVAPLSRFLGNPGLLPAHKLVATAALASGRLARAGGGAHGPSAAALRASEGAFLCTDCGRCTRVCPVGLDLADLWEAGRGDLADAGLPAPPTWIQGRPAPTWAEALERVADASRRADGDVARLPLSSDPRTFSRCVQCQTCTNVCPVVAHGAEAGIDLTPQKVMNLLRLGLADQALGSRMVWACAACYQCQEHCPEGIRVADILLELRSLGVRRLATVRTGGERP